jgi:hypothetical protein
MSAVILAVLLGVAQPFDSHALAQGGPELIERTLAIIGGQAITLTDVRAAMALGLIEVPVGADPVPAATKLLIERALVLREVERYAPAEPSDADIEARVRTTVARYPTIEAFRAALAAVAFSDDELRAWARDDLRMAAYIEQRFTDVERRRDLIADWIADLRRRTPVVELKQ